MCKVLLVFSKKIQMVEHMYKVFLLNIIMIRHYEKLEFTNNDIDNIQCGLS